MPVAGASQKDPSSRSTPSEEDLPDVGEDEEDDGDQESPTSVLDLDAEKTNALPRIESSIPSEEDVREGVFEHEKTPHRRVVVLVVLASLIVVGGVTLFIAHPWDPNFFSAQPTADADMSKAGFPGTIEKLQGQDSETAQTSDAATDAATTSSGDPIFDSLSSDYAQLADLRDQVDANESTFDQSAITGDLATRVAGKNDADALGITISNLITDIKKIDVSSTPYAEDQEHLTTLANWLRNRTDALSEAWALDVASDDPSADEAKIKAPLDRNAGSDGTSSYATLFSENYSAWEPVKSSS
jgi:hypothetical protein